MTKWYLMLLGVCPVCAAGVRAEEAAPPTLGYDV
jgi:hypothetical protein